MKKYKIFTSLQQEENWINHIQSQGYQLVKVKPQIACYEFQPTTTSPKLIRLDFHEQIMQTDYINYLSLFQDSGWTCIERSKRNGTHYFQQDSLQAGNELFSDIDSKKALYKRYKKVALSYFIFYLALYIVFVQSRLQHGYQLLQPKTWFLTPGLWERDGQSFWFGFFLELPFALFRSGIIEWLLLAIAIYFFTISQKVKKEMLSLAK